MKRLLIGLMAACLCVAAAAMAAIAIEPPPILLGASALAGPAAITLAVVLVAMIVAPLFMTNPQAKEMKRQAEQMRRRAYDEAEFAQRMEHEGSGAVDFIPSQRTRFDPGRIAMPANTA